MYTYIIYYTTSASWTCQRNSISITRGGSVYYVGWGKITVYQ